MIDPIREQILQKLRRVSDLTPEMRFGQLIASLAFLAAGPWDETLWDLEDDKLLEALSRHLCDLSVREQTIG